MASFPTVPGRLVPWIANALTVAVLLSATWWSSVQRPGPVTLDPGKLTAEASTTQPMPSHSKKQATPGANPTPAAQAPARGDMSTATGRLSGEALLPVAYQPAPAITR